MWSWLEEVGHRSYDLVSPFLAHHFTWCFLLTMGWTLSILPWFSVILFLPWSQQTIEYNCRPKSTFFLLCVRYFVSRMRKVKIENKHNRDDQSQEMKRWGRSISKSKQEQGRSKTAFELLAAAVSRGIFVTFQLAEYKHPQFCLNQFEWNLSCLQLKCS